METTVIAPHPCGPISARLRSPSCPCPPQLLKVALPLSLTQLASRLRHNYYRQPAALASDIATIASNAIAFNGEDSEIAEDAAALAQYLTLVLHGEVGTRVGSGRLDGEWPGEWEA